jgi:hypothetical protein
VFADPVSDVAILGSPDNQELFKQAEAYEALTEASPPLPIADVLQEESRGWLLTLEGQWFRCKLEYIKELDGPLWVTDTAQPIEGGMSGSPIISDAGAAVGIVALGNESGCEDGHGSINPRLVRDLPGWLLHAGG